MDLRPHYLLHLGCGCIIPIPGPWIDGKPAGYVKSKAEPTQLCKRHLVAFYMGEDVRFP
jgi:hypothetical protein